MCRLKAVIVQDDKEIQFHFDDHNCCDMTGAIKLAKAICPKINLIRTFSGIEVGAIYRRNHQKWEAFMPARRYSPTRETQRGRP